MSSDGLFDMAPIPPSLPEPAGLSYGQRLTLRQAAAITKGQHPLSVVLHNHMPLHALAATDREGDGLRCGSCLHRAAGQYPKCTFGTGQRIGANNWPRATHGIGTDLRAWWPACQQYEQVVA